MKESYREGVANHPGPEPCEGSRKAALEALDRGICRLGIELRNQMVQGADGVGLQGRQQRVARQRECGAGRRENAMSDKTLTHGGGESYGGIVPTKQPNKSGRPPAEVAEGRRSAKESPMRGPMLDTVPENTGAL